MFNFIDVLFENHSIWINVLIAFLIIYFVYYVKNILSYPRGPLPLPILGNVLEFRGKFTDRPILYKLSDWSKKYGPIYTIWGGSKPYLFVNNYELNNEASIVKKNDYIERSDSIMHEVAKSETQNIFSINGPYWEALRKVGLFSVRKFAVSERLPQMVCEVMDEAVELMAKDKHFNPQLYIDFMIYNILGLTAYGKKFGPMDDKVFKEAKRANDEFYEVSGNGLLCDYFPWLRPIFRKQENHIKEVMKASVDITKDAFFEHKKTFTSGVIRDFSDCVLEAKEEAIREKFERSKFLNDNNLYMVVSDLFQAGTDTTQTTMRWAILFLGNYPTIQQKIYDEINENIGDRIPTQDDKTVLPYTFAFLMETLRYRPPAPIGMDHMNSFETELAGIKIPKKTVIIFNLFEQNNDPKYWKNPEKFDPNRFIDEKGQLITGRLPSFVTFGLGRRNCPGEKLALINAFLMITRLVQKLKIELSTGAGTADLDPLNMLVGCFPRDYQINCSLR